MNPEQLAKVFYNSLQETLNIDGEEFPFTIDFRIDLHWENQSEVFQKIWTATCKEIIDNCFLKLEGLPDGNDAFVFLPDYD